MDVRDYNQDRELAKQFFRDFTYADEQGEVINKYAPTLTQLANREAFHMFVELADVEQFNQDLANQIYTNTRRYVQIFYAAIDDILLAYRTKQPEVRDPMDVFIDQRLLIVERNQKQNSNPNPAGPASLPTSNPVRMAKIDIDGKYPPDLIRRYEIFFKPANFITIPMRQVLADKVGSFVTVRGIVTRITDVKPRITIVTYTCDQCGCESFQPVTHPNFTPLFECSSAVCKANKALGRLAMQTRGSKFVKFQEVKLQENSDQVPEGHIPRTMTVHVYGELTRSCLPGDHISVSGSFHTLENTGFRARTGGLSADTYIYAHYMTHMNKTEDEEIDEQPLSTEEAQELYKNETNFLHKLSSSIAPEIFGHEQLKKALLLLLVGGVDRSPHGMKIRGNINICLMGDPGVAKSQMLSFVNRLASRSNYTTGRGSSGVGLTAAVLKDPLTNELVLEGGALVLADKGICCIDEFDKMMEADRTAIHEVMEQQTVSIAKAGIMTTLNARVSILAAANPAWGRYNPNQTVQENLQLPPALLSRFDLIWLILDASNEERDLELADHVLHIHKNPNPTEVTVVENTLDMKVMRRYINLCKTKNPVVPEHLTERLVKIYLDIRCRKRFDPNADTLFTSPRSLLAIIRLSTAFARLRLADEVTEEDVGAAVDLYNYSRDSLESKRKKGDGAKTKVLEILRQLSERHDTNELSMPEILESAESQGLSEAIVRGTLDTLVEMGTYTVSGDIVTSVYYKSTNNGGWKSTIYDTGR